MYKMAKRLNNISILRLIACIGIFCFHYFTIFTHINTTAYMPSPIFVFIFVFISGFLYSQKEIDNSKKWLSKQLTKLLIPTAVYLLIGALLFIVVGLIRYNGSIIETFQGFVWNNPSDNRPNFVFGNLWFLIALSICYLFTPLIYKLANKSFKNKYGFSLTIVLIIIVSAVEILFNFFCPVFTAYVISYFIGRSFFKTIIEEKHVSIPILTGVILIGFLLLWYFVVGNIKYRYIDIHLRTLRHVVELIISLSFSIFFIYVARPINKYELKFLKYTDKYSFPFYLDQQLFMCGTLSFYYLIPSWYFVPVVILSIITSIIILFLSDWFNKLIYSRHSHKQGA